VRPSIELNENQCYYFTSF